MFNINTGFCTKMPDSTTRASFIFQNLVFSCFFFVNLAEKKLDCDGFDTFYMHNKPVCILWFGKNTYYEAERRCQRKEGTVLEIQDETLIPSLLRKYQNSAGDLNSFWVRYQDGVMILKAGGMHEIADLEENHGILCMKKPIYPYREYDVNSQTVEFLESRENWYRVTNTSPNSAQFLIRSDRCSDYDANSVSEASYQNFVQCNFGNANFCSKDYYSKILTSCF